MEKYGFIALFFEFLRWLNPLVDRPTLVVVQIWGRTLYRECPSRMQAEAQAEDWVRAAHKQGYVNASFTAYYYPIVGRRKERFDPRAT
ncbi:MAG: hypothetical protein U1D67_08205 [Dehalococcoidia bacterium]|nr:hypothetical protein [Dehalococcoidia bacterium]